MCCQCIEISGFTESLFLFYARKNVSKKEMQKKTNKLKETVFYQFLLWYDI